MGTRPAAWGQKGLSPHPPDPRWGMAGRHGCSPGALVFCEHASFRGRAADAEGLAVCPPGSGHMGRVPSLCRVSFEPRPRVFSCVSVD